MKKVFLSVLLLSICLPGCSKKNKAVVKGAKVRPAVQTVVQREGNTVSAQDADEFPLEDEAGFNVFEDEQKKQVEGNSPDENLTWEEVDADEQPEFERVQFGYDSSDLDQAQKGKIERNAKNIKEKLKNNPKSNVIVKGHSCKIAKNKEYNYSLSQERAQNIKNEYEGCGIPAENLKAVGYGSSQLLVDNEGMESQAPNRRAETVVS